ncbi:MAG TPA: hypothetical protein VFV89_08140 [Nocardioides sp.]|uniref:DUF7714 family protein n=1 Tax=Nocardioides sp. TaxID=35761 RepID=UPI002E307767|nr:hypothetical protein [Nocardioides sp.]HEX5087763.1 hypothetical protein [Nocardioides sp.]
MTERREALNASGTNVVPGAYRGVAVASVGCELDEASLRRHFLGLEAYRRTRFIVVRNGAETALVAVQKASWDPLFSPITALRLLVDASECVYLEEPDVDTSIPGALARAARTHAPGKRGVVVQGRYSHVSFIIDPAPLRVTVREVVPPYPPKLLDQAQHVLDVAEHLPPIELVPDAVELDQLARSRTSANYLLPCRGGGVSIQGATTDYLDERPDRREWTLVGCERSQQIHEWFYGERAEQVDICPRKRVGGTGAVLAKCCLLETDLEVDDDRVIVPWGATLSQVSEALTILTREWEPMWAPA